MSGSAQTGIDACAPPDADLDGIPDHLDKCPRAHEDMDGFEDLDGCPEIDNDKDGIADNRDRCPDEPGGVNGVPDRNGDGCPRVQCFVTMLESVKLWKSAQFAPGSVTPLASSNPALDMAATAARGYRTIRILIVGRADSAGSPAQQGAVAGRRAQAVYDALIARGAPPHVLAIDNRGGEEAAQLHRTAKVRAYNRRVEFKIARQPCFGRVESKYLRFFDKDQDGQVDAAPAGWQPATPLDPCRCQGSEEGPRN